MAEEETTTKTKASGKLAVLLIRGTAGARHDVLAALKTLKLFKKNSCVILEDNAQSRGVINRCKDYIAFGPVSADTIKALSAKGDAPFRLAPPRGGFARKGIKKNFSQGGALGAYPELDSLITRMI